MEGLVILLLLAGIIPGAFCAYLAKQKNRNPASWFILGFLFNIFALIAIAASGKLEGDPQAAGGASLQEASRTREQVAADERFERWTLIIIAGLIIVIGVVIGVFQALV